MTDAERAECERLRRELLSLMGKCGAIEQQAEDAAMVRLLARKAGLQALRLAQEFSKRVIGAELGAELAEVQAAGYDLGALSTAPAANVEE